MNVVLEWMMGSPTTQAGAIDVIAVRKSDGTLTCSPFHVKLSKVSKKGEKKVVNLKVNGKLVDLSMKLGPAGEAFFVERTRDYTRKDYPPGALESPHNPEEIEPMSPRDGTEETSSPVPAEISVSQVTLPIPAQQRTTHENQEQVAAEPAPASSSVAAAPATEQVHCSRPTRKVAPRHRSYSDGDAGHHHHIAHDHFPLPFYHSTARHAGSPTVSGAPELQWEPEAPACTGDPNHGGDAVEGNTVRRRARAASDMSEMMGASLRQQAAAHRVERLEAITGHNSAATLDGLGGEAAGSRAEGGDSHGAGPTALTIMDPAHKTATSEESKADAAVAEEAAGPWLWRWGTLPVKKRAKGSSGDLHAQHAIKSSAQGAAEGHGPKDSRGRAVSLPLMSDDGAGTAQLRRDRGRDRRKHRHDLGLRNQPEITFQHKVTAVEAEITPGAATDEGSTETKELEAMYAAASADASTYRTLSLCGHLLSEETPRSEQEVQELISQHLVSPKAITEGAVLRDPALVVLLGEYLLPLTAAERLVAERARSSDGSGQGVGEEEVKAALSWAEKERQTPLPAWAGRRVSQWAGKGVAATENALDPAFNRGTPAGHLNWQESFSDLVQAYRVQNISDLHSSGACTDRDSFATSPWLRNLVAPDGKHPVSYRELWRRQQKELAKGSSFTALLTLDAGSSSSLYELDKWASSEDPDGGYGVGYSLHPEHTSEASGSQHSLPMLISLEAAESKDAQHDVGREESRGELLPPQLSPSPAPATYMRDAPFRSLGDREQAADGGDSSQPSLCEEGDTDGDNISLQDIDFDDISPEPAGGDFYDSDTDSYLSLSLEDGEGGGAPGGGKVQFQNHTGGGSERAAGGVEGSGLPRRRLRRYRYRKVLVPSQEQLALLDLRDGANELSFELEGCAPLRASLFVWPADAKVVVTDLEGVFCRNQQSARTSGVWISFLGGGSYYSSASTKTEFDACIRLFSGLHRQGYRIIYMAQGAQSSGSSASSLLSSQEYLASIRASTGEALPAGPVFKSPDSLVRAFGAARTEVFKASALRGVKSLFPPSHNPYHACFCTREADAVPFARFGFPEGRIFIVSDKGEIKTTNRTCTLSFARLIELLHQIFPEIVDSQRTSQSKPILVAAPEPQDFTKSAAGGLSSPRSSVDGPSSAPALGKPATSPPLTAVTAPAATALSTVSNAAAARSVRVNSSSTDDAYSDFNFWKIPPAILEDEY